MKVAVKVTAAAMPAPDLLPAPAWGDASGWARLPQPREFRSSEPQTSTIRSFLPYLARRLAWTVCAS
jgi:hypothetical protein